MYLKNAWYVAGFSEDFPNGALTTRTYLEVPLVFYRKDDGAVVAMEDRCCHRLAPLSHGQIEGDDLRCMYHGLKFAPSGKCIEIPGQPRIPSSMCVRSYPTAESHGCVWIWMGQPEKASQADIPDNVGPDLPGWSMLPGRLEVNANYMLVADNLLDLSHLSYVHRDSFGPGLVFGQTRPKVERLEKGVRVSRWLLNQPTAKYIREKIDATHLDVWITYDFIAPGLFLLYAEMHEPGAAQKFGEDAPSGVEPLHKEYTSQAVTPESLGKSRYFFSYGSWDRTPGLAEFYRDFSYLAFNEDAEIVSAQQRTIDASPGITMQPTSFDAATLQYRWILERLMRDEGIDGPLIGGGRAESNHVQQAP
ncbi:Rieske 2Fe-2S domain-containing protein [Massilia dura]|uniref:Rieske 2Fe-2S domain-containing protein n=1 Tax=Pseudoduganella dura TaxID=321982 RepID=A0A6I3X9R0_9BURK|nr:aromatic ring-hydroxylating dioxygenase subunit alpha [Pseudoduganella dura]MUI11350.1 Rieske 2Fe-2S domain-containing protein [Pseudoduganella dura]GGX95584.1 (2Fe-2S)-binding protein [Pseudoduganella dura]